MLNYVRLHAAQFRTSLLRAYQFSYDCRVTTDVAYGEGLVKLIFELRWRSIGGWIILCSEFLKAAKLKQLTKQVLNNA